MSSSNSAFVESWRERHPSSYSLKIQNISQLKRSTQYSDERYQSRYFASGEFYWRLIIYPKGNSKDDGSGFISMYVEIHNESLINGPNEVFATLSFFVYNKKKNSYFTIREAEVKRFNAMKLVWGLSQVLSLDTFNNPKNGFIFDGDQCEFGVDVDVSLPFNDWEILSFNEKLPSPKFSVTIKNFSALNKNFHTSDVFSMGERKWVLMIYPKRFDLDGNWLSISLQLAGHEMLNEDDKIYTSANIRILDPLGINHLKHKFNCWYNISSQGWGLHEFVSIAELQKTYLDNEDTLNVDIEFDVISSTKYSPV